MKRLFTTRSLRVQLALLGLAAVVLPLAVLLLVVFSTTSSEEVSTDPETDSTATTISESESSSSVPAPVLVAAVLLAFGGSGAVWWWSGRAVRPMKSITRVANEIQGGSLDRRIGLRGASAEVQALGDSFDGMLERLEGASATQQRLIEDTSHELRTPLAALAVNNEVILSNRMPTQADYRSSAERSEALIARLQLTIDEMLRGARSRNQATRQVDNDLMTIVRRVAEQHRTLNPHVPISVEGPDSLRLGIDGPSVQRALVNLIENASRFSPPGEPIEVVASAGVRPRLSVTDSGPGIAPGEIDKVFDRYYRSAHDEAPGSGIGLALVKQVADAHGGVAVISPPPGQDHGTRFTITFSSSAAG